MPTATVIVGDSLDVMQAMEPGSVDCVITDPPYSGMGFGGSATRNWIALAPYWQEMNRVVSAVQRIAISQPARFVEAYRPLLPPLTVVTIPDAFADRRGKPAYFVLVNPLVPEAGPVRQLPSAGVPDSSHPNDRDIAAMGVVVEAMSVAGDTVLDPFCGSAAIGVACVLLGRNYIGIEAIEARAVDAQHRLDAATRLRSKVADDRSDR